MVWQMRQEMALVGPLFQKIMAIYWAAFLVLPQKALFSGPNRCYRSPISDAMSDLPPGWVKNSPNWAIRIRD